MQATASGIHRYIYRPSISASNVTLFQVLEVGLHLIRKSLNKGLV